MLVVKNVIYWEGLETALSMLLKWTTENSFTNSFSKMYFGHQYDLDLDLKLNLSEVVLYMVPKAKYLVFIFVSIILLSFLVLSSDV